MFNAPSSGVWFTPKDLIGHLILVTQVASVEPHYDDMKKANVEKVTFDYVDLDGQQLLIQDALDTHPGIVSRIKRFAGTGEAMVLGRIGQVPTKQPQPAFVLENATDDAQAVARASAWVTEWKAGNIQAPQTPAPQPVSPQPVVPQPTIQVPQPQPQPQQFVPQPQTLTPQPLQPQPVTHVAAPQGFQVQQPPVQPAQPNGASLPDGVTPELLRQMSPEAQRQLLQSLGVPAEAVEMLRQMSQ